LDGLGELAVINLGQKFDQLPAWHKHKWIDPIFQWKLAGISISLFGIGCRKGTHTFLLCLLLVHSSSANVRLSNWNFFNKILSIRIKFFLLGIYYFLPFGFHLCTNATFGRWKLGIRSRARAPLL
jgi:hypothetical protein